MMISQSVTITNMSTHQPVAGNKYSGSGSTNGVPKTFHRGLKIQARQPLSLTASKTGSMQGLMASRKDYDSIADVRMAATPQRNVGNFFTQMGEKINNAIDSVGVDSSYMGNPQSGQYLQLATGMSSNQAEFRINQSDHNVMKFQQIQNSLSQNSSILKSLNKDKQAKARTQTVMRSGPTISGSSPNMNEDHMDEEMLDPFFSEVEMAPDDPILKLSLQFKEDQEANKVNLGVGAYRGEDGKPFVFGVVKDADEILAKATKYGHADKEYSPIDGSKDFQHCARQVLFGWDNHEILLSRLIGLYNLKNSTIGPGRIATVQTLSGTGALRVGGEFLKEFASAPIYVSNPTWGNHIGIFEKCGLEVRKYKYFDQETKGLDFEGMLADLNAAPENSIILLHTCAHNPTGVDATMDQWKAIAKVMKEKKLMPFFDTAYQGFVSGDLEKDGASVRYFLEQGFTMVVAQSFAKIMGLYGERVGALHVVCQDTEAAKKVTSQIKILVRQNYSSPPIHGAKIVTQVLMDSKSRALWLQDLVKVTDRMTKMRVLLRKNLEDLDTPGDWSHITSQIGMFSFTGLTKEQSELMVSKYHVYMTNNGRISVAGLTENNVSYVAKSIKSCLELE